MKSKRGEFPGIQFNLLTDLPENRLIFVIPACQTCVSCLIAVLKQGREKLKQSIYNKH